MLGSSVTIDRKANAARQPCAIKIAEPGSRQFYLVILPPISYFVSVVSTILDLKVIDEQVLMILQELMKNALNMARLPNKELDTEFRLFTEDSDLLTPERWVNIMEGPDLEDLQLVLIRDWQTWYESDGSDFEITRGRIKRHLNSERKSKLKMQSSDNFQVVVQSPVPSLDSVVNVSTGTEDSKHKGPSSMPDTILSKLGRPDGTSIMAQDETFKNEASDSQKAGSQQDRGVHFSDQIEMCGSDETADINGLVTSMQGRLIIQPFFTWKVAAQGSRHASDEQLHARVYRLLDQVDKAMARKRQRLHRYIYRRGFECTPQELQCRHPYLTNLDLNEGSFPTVEMGQETSSTSTVQPSDERDDNARISREQDHPAPKWENILRTYLRPLFDVSKAVAQTFVPAEMEVIHRCWKKLWGSLDRIMRVCYLHASRHRHKAHPR